jgi:hypothetical protein
MRDPYEEVMYELAIEIGTKQPGFIEPWLSSFTLDRLIDGRLHKNIRASMIRGLGYVLHPGLKDGRVENVIKFEGGRPQLYVKMDSWEISTLLPDEPSWSIEARYISDQGFDVADRIENDVKTAIDENRPGFVYPWVSSFALGQIVEDRGEAKKIMSDMGYILHPALKGGRVNNVIKSEGGKPRIYVKLNTVQSEISSPTEVVREYKKSFVC